MAMQCNLCVSERERPVGVKEKWDIILLLSIIGVFVSLGFDSWIRSVRLELLCFATVGALMIPTLLRLSQFFRNNVWGRHYHLFYDDKGDYHCHEYHGICSFIFSCQVDGKDESRQAQYPIFRVRSGGWFRGNLIITLGRTLDTHWHFVRGWGRGRDFVIADYFGNRITQNSDAATDLLKIVEHCESVHDFWGKFLLAKEARDELASWVDEVLKMIEANRDMGRSEHAKQIRIFLEGKIRDGAQSPVLGRRHDELASIERARAMGIVESK